MMRRSRNRGTGIQESEDKMTDEECKEALFKRGCSVTHRIEIGIDGEQPICFEIEENILKIIEVLIFLSDDSKAQDTKKPEPPPQIHEKTPTPKTEPVLNNLSSGLATKEARKQTEAKFGWYFRLYG